MFTETQGNKKYDQKSYCGVMESTTAPMVCVIKFSIIHTKLATLVIFVKSVNFFILYFFTWFVAF